MSMISKGKKTNKRRRRTAAAIWISVFAVVLVSVAVFGISLSAEDAPSVAITFSDGRSDAVLFADISATATKSVSGCISLPGKDFADIVPHASVTAAEKLDSETFKFSADDDRYYAFTGWQIVGTSELLPAKTVFQPGDTITPEVLANYASDGSLELAEMEG